MWSLLYECTSQKAEMFSQEYKIEAYFWIGLFFLERRGNTRQSNHIFPVLFGGPTKSLKLIK